MRLLVQSCETGRFLVPDLEGDVCWVLSLREAGPGVLDDVEQAVQVAQEWAEVGELVQLVDLDRLGAADDYEADAGGGGAPRSGETAARALPDGNHGENNGGLVP